MRVRRGSDEDQKRGRVGIGDKPVKEVGAILHERPILHHSVTENISEFNANVSKFIPKPFSILFLFFEMMIDLLTCENYFKKQHRSTGQNTC